MTDATKALDDRDFMSALLDIVIPASASGELPGAGSLGLERDVATGLRADPMLGPVVEPDLDKLREVALAEHPGGLQGMTAEDGARLVEAQVASNPFLMLGLLRHLYPAYYRQPQVLEGIGEPPRPPFPEGFDVEATDAGLLEILEGRRRGKP